MKIKYIILLLCSININMFAQKNDTDRKPNPFYNGHLSEYYSPQQIDFSRDYLTYTTNTVLMNLLDRFTNYNCDSVWLTPSSQQNGVIGRNYQRIQIHIDKILKSNKNPRVYSVSGKSRVNKNICNFSGTIELTNLFCSKCDYDDSLMCGSLIGKYIFYEDRIQNHSGHFEGIIDCEVSIDEKHNRIILDESAKDGDGYSNRTFVGTWTDYKTGVSKKCIWGDYRLPYTFDFDQGDGEMIVNNKYVKFGWQSFNDGSEYIEVSNDKWELKDKWWRK